MWNNAGRDCEYGNYRDINNETYWWDDFYPNNETCKKAQVAYEELERDALETAASICGLGTDGWDWDDWQMFKEKIGL